MIKPVTFQGIFNFKANLYALEVRSRFIDQSKANGYYKGYGNELAATIIGNTIRIGTGAFVIQGRMSEVVTPEVVSPTMTNGYVGYVVARCETYHTSDEENTTLVAYVGTSLAAIPLTQEDIYQASADTTNKVYEYPIYSFAISGSNITNLVKLIEVVGDYERLKTIVDNALAAAQSAVATANSANTKSDNAVSVAGGANTKSDNAVATANSANTKSDNAVATANTAKNTADGAVVTINTQHAQMTAEIDALAEQIGERQGTTITLGGAAQSTYNGDKILNEDDTININGGVS